MSLCQDCGSEKTRLFTSEYCATCENDEVHVSSVSDIPEFPFPSQAAELSKYVDNSPITSGPFLQVVNGQSLQLSDWTSRSLFSSLEINENSWCEWRLFEYGRSQQIPGTNRIASAADTSVQRSSDHGLPTGWEFFCYGMAAEATEICDSDPSLKSVFHDWTMRTAIRLQYNHKCYFETSLSQLLERTPITINTAKGSDRSLLGSEDPNPQNLLRLLAYRRGVAFTLPVHMRHNIAYSVQVDSDGVALGNLKQRLGDRTLFCRVHLMGLQKTPVI